MGISKDTYYNSKDPQESLEERYQALKPLILSIIEKNPGYGYPRIKVALEKLYNIVINHKTLMKLLKLWSLQVKRKIKKPKKNFFSEILDFLQGRANLLSRLIRNNKITECGQVIVSDVTEIHFNGFKAYLCVHMDFFGKMIYGYCLSLTASRTTVLTSLKMAVAAIKRTMTRNYAKRIILHQDRGSVYTSADYITAAIGYHFMLSYSRKGEPGDNAVNESFFSRLKAEWLDAFSDAKDFEELKMMVSRAIDYYNNDRYHSSLNYHTPAEFLQMNLSSLTLN